MPHWECCVLKKFQWPNKHKNIIELADKLPLKVDKT